MVGGKNIFYILILTFLHNTACFASQNTLEKKSDQEILLKNNAYILGPMLAVGFSQWDWGKDKFHSKDEGFFQQNSRYGGADKVGHFYSSYLISELLAKKFVIDGIEPKKAALYGSSSAFIMTGLVELGDATSKEHGFSVEDQIMNSIGTLASYIILVNPDLDKKIDFKIDYFPTSNPLKSGGRLIDDYDGARYITSLKLSGFDFARNNFLSFFELQLSYRATGYINHEFSRSREIGFGIGLNINKVIEHYRGKKGNKYASGFFEYYQPHYTYTTYDKNLNR